MITITYISIFIYLLFGFVFMTVCAKMGWMDKYDPAIFYWITWPVVLVVWSFKLLFFIAGLIHTPLERYVDNLKPKIEGDN